MYGCPVSEARARTSGEEFLDWCTYFDGKLTMRDFLNICQANICSFVRQSFRGGKLEEIGNFIIDFEKYRHKDDEELSAELQKKADNASAKMNLVFGGLAEKGIIKKG